MSTADGLGLPVRTRSAAYVSVLGVVVALLAAGLAVPYLFGHAETAARGARFSSGPSASAIGGPADTVAPTGPAASGPGRLRRRRGKSAFAVARRGRAWIGGRRRGSAPPGQPEHLLPA